MSGRQVAERVLGRVEAVAMVLPVLALPVLLGIGLVDKGRRRVARGGKDAGSVLEWVLVAALLITIAGVVGAVMLTKLGDKANDLDLTTP